MPQFRQLTQDFGGDQVKAARLGIQADVFLDPHEVCISIKHVFRHKMTVPSFRAPEAGSGERTVTVEELHNGAIGAGTGIE